MSHPYGYQREPDEYPDPRCPFCRNFCTKLYVKDGEIIGCDQCMEEDDPTEYSECFEEID